MLHYLLLLSGNLLLSNFLVRYYYYFMKLNHQTSFSNVLQESLIAFWVHCDTFWRRQWHPTPVLLPGKSHGPRSLVGCSPWGRYESDTTEWLHFHFHALEKEMFFNRLQCSCLENPRDKVACWAAVYGVAKSRTRLKRLSSSNDTFNLLIFTFSYPILV